MKTRIKSSECLRKSIFLLILVMGCFFCRSGVDLDEVDEVLRFPQIRPDYAQTVIPPNIAPLNFAVLESGEGYFVRIGSIKGKSIEVHSRDPRIIIPSKPWKALLAENRGNALFFDVYVKDDGPNWRHFKTIPNRIANEDIDGHMVYRKMKPIYSIWENIGIYQRSLENYDESVILHGKSYGHGCVNCHTFNKNRPDRMFIGIRSLNYGSSTLLVENGAVRKIGAKWGYTAWHPSGRWAVYPVMNVHQFFHSGGLAIRDVIDLDSVMVYYNLEEEKVKLEPGFSAKDRLESYPCWTPDGRTLYFCSAAIPWTDRTEIPPENYDQVKYDLRRISFDPANETWSNPEVVLSSQETGLSILLPRISPDGRFLLFCMCDYGVFPVFRPSSDLYMMDLQTMAYRRLSINTSYSESWHSWSSNSRWMVFSSKKQGGVFTRPYFSYVDESGKVYKSFVLPQKDPLFYDSFLKTYSVPELITGPIKVNSRALARAVRSAEMIKVDTFSSASPQPGKSKALIRE